MDYMHFRLQYSTSKSISYVVMTQENIIKILAGASRLAKESGRIIKSSSSTYIEENIIKGKYVSREEYDQLKKLVIKLEKEVSNLTASNKN